MLELRPSCEHCDKDLPPESQDAQICSFECTFCNGCAHGVFENVCPNCGGGFTARPVRPAKAWKAPWWLGDHPASTKRVHGPKNVKAHREFAKDLKKIDPHYR
ncbi:DUF1272 domain-containing protein [Kiloniella majae]|uniref:DUF1272 domain-containing protein n=1 Tax=Kiloniella majae TaxID=1938558 RepID=UPI000A279785|nr:DUF1272 domain-containing protein [Kiloniella majae]